ncbi:hypothetical protein KC329_g32 [Hortaea werneckii]|nr:hypothetical protein KC329_g32 [Hortaea werneckii]
MRIRAGSTALHLSSSSPSTLPISGIMNHAISAPSRAKPDPIQNNAWLDLAVSFAKRAEMAAKTSLPIAAPALLQAAMKPIIWPRMDVGKHSDDSKTTCESKTHGLPPTNSVAQKTSDEGTGDVEAIDDDTPAKILDERALRVRSSRYGAAEYAEGHTNGTRCLRMADLRRSAKRCRNAFPADR